MNWEALGIVIGISAVVLLSGTVVYLALQIRVCNTLLRIASRERGYDAFGRWRSKLIQDDQLENLLHRGNTNLAELSEQERRRYDLLVGELLANLRSQYMRAWDLKHFRETDRLEEICEAWSQAPGIRENLWKSPVTPFEQPYANMLARVTGGEGT